MFSQPTKQPRFSDPLDEHVKNAFNLYYKKPYADALTLPKQEQTYPIARLYHGIQHATRVAINLLIFANLYRYYESLEPKPIAKDITDQRKFKASSLTTDEIHMLQIAALFHDAAREDDGEDLWDKESAALFYQYIMNCISQVETGQQNLKDLAIKIAEAIANKDAPRRVDLDPAQAKHDVYYQIKLDKNNKPILDKNGHLTWETLRVVPPKEIYAELIGNADCLDILRARDSFNPKYLDFYKFITYHPSAKEILALLIRESASVIEVQGDARRGQRLAIKSNYEKEDSYQAALNTYSSLSTVAPDNKDNFSSINPRLYYKLVPKLSREILPIAELDDVITQSLQADCKLSPDIEPLDGDIYVRAIAFPSCISNRNKKEILKGDTDKAYFFESPINSADEEREETLAFTEIYKTNRRIGIATRSKKANNKTKNGNSNRSVTRLYKGGSVFGQAGFIIKNPDLAHIKDISLIDESTGRGKKKDLQHKFANSTDEEKKAQLGALAEKQKLDFASVNFGAGLVTKNNEIILDIFNYDEIYYTQDPVVMNFLVNGNYYPPHPHCPKLEAIFIYYEYLKSRQQNKHLALPIYEYSGIHGFRVKRDFDENDIVKLWMELCEDYLRKMMQSKDDAVYTMDLETIKISAMYKSVKAKSTLVKRNASADSNYPAGLKERINIGLKKLKEDILAENRAHVLSRIEKQCSIVNLKDSEYRLLLNSPELLKNPVVYEQLSHDIHSELAIFEIPDKQFELLLNTFFLDNQSDLIKIIQLAKKSNHHLYVEHIKPYIEKRAKNQIELWGRQLEIPLTFNLSDFCVELDKLLYYAQWFDVADISSAINPLLEKVFIYIRELSKDHPIEHYYAELMKIVTRYNLLKGDEYREIFKAGVKLAHDLGEKLIANPTPGHAILPETCEYYFSLAQYLDIPLYEQRNVFVSFMKSNHPLQNPEKLADIIKNNPLMLEFELFKLFFKKIRFETLPPSKNIYFISDVEYIDLINSILNILCEKIAYTSKHTQFMSTLYNEVRKVTYALMLELYDEWYKHEISDRIGLLSIYLVFAGEIMKVPNTILCDALKRWANIIIDKNEWINDRLLLRLVKYLKDVRVALNYDTDFFQILVTRTSLKDSSGQYQSIKHYIKTINRLKDLMPTRTFDEKQMLIVEKAITEKRQELFLYHLNDCADFIKNSTMKQLCCDPEIIHLLENPDYFLKLLQKISPFHAGEVDLTAYKSRVNLWITRMPNGILTIKQQEPFQQQLRHLSESVRLDEFRVKWIDHPSSLFYKKPQPTLAFGDVLSQKLEGQTPLFLSIT